MRALTFLASLALLLLVQACVVTKHEVIDPDLVAASSEVQLEFLRSLAGTWEGTGSGGGQTFPTEVRYRVTAAGSAVEEVLFAGTAHEMVSMYHRDGPFLVMTHYCAAGNQPRMRAQWTLPPPQLGHMDLEFEFLDVTNLASPEALHMHEARFEQTQRDQLKATWTAWKDGKPDHSAIFELRRKTEASH